MTEGMPVASGPGGVSSVTIANGQTTSGVVDLGTKRLARIDCPAAVDGTSLSFKVSTDGQSFVDLYQADGTQYAVTIGASRGVAVDLTMFAGARYLKLVGTQSTADRVFALSTLA